MMHSDVAVLPRCNVVCTMHPSNRSDPTQNKLLAADHPHLPNRPMIQWLDIYLDGPGAGLFLGSISEPLCPAQCGKPPRSVDPSLYI
jgi:hypothetical protein